ncbi:MAG: hypothetical protein QXJ74_03950 [Nitrososphaera sp.]|uniref:hypothetical protein n=1 Tax=Nitrososphaera sp. TaxID=1971748 RepID=UPI00185ED015|nr:hypothetical protein [Nitrososphaera sp.]NWG38190.1 hypothetical protein [Nitrososphaera sp.]
MQRSIQYTSDREYASIEELLERKLDFLLHIEDKIAEANRAHNSAYASTLWKIQIDEERHARMLRDLLV